MGGLQPSDLIILAGRPGMGKTLLGRACAGSIVRTHSAAPESFATSFIYVKGPELLVKWVGDTEEAIRNLFEHARTHFKKWGYPAVIFIDEADALLTRRGVKTAAGMEQTVVPQFNAEMDGLEDSGAFVLLATNRLDILDPAIIRPGRCDRKFHVEPPTRENAPEYLEIHMRELPVARPATAQDLIQSAVAAWFGDKYPLYKLETDKGERVFTLANLASGAMMAGLVERATAHAIDRNLEAAEPDGLTAADFDAALADIHAEEFGVSHFDELREYIETERLELKNIVPCRNDADKAAPMPKSQSSMTLAIAVPVGGGQGTVKEVPEGDDKKKDWTN
jgi:proteasome-associated ATPase